MTPDASVPQPLWDAVPAALRRFNVLRSMPRTAFGTLRVLLGMERLKDAETPVLLTFSISEDYARLWYRFVTRAMRGKWQIVIGDSAGDFDAKKFPGAKVIKFSNRPYHGAKVDALLRHVIGDQPVFLCDDDKCLLGDVTPWLEKLRAEDVAAVSLCPRKHYVFRIDGQEYQPMGTYALMFKPAVFRKLGLHVQSGRGASAYKVFKEGVKVNPAYDTADEANERLLLAHQRVITEASPMLAGFDGMSAPRILLIERGKDYVKSALEQAEHYRQNSVNGAVMRGVACITQFERLYRDAFGEAPKFVSGFTLEELADLAARNPRLDAEQRASIDGYFRRIEETYHMLKTRLA